jgi:uncharacterized membrane protein
MTDETGVAPRESLVRMTHAIYGLYAASLFIGVTALIAIVLDYVYRDDAKGTWLESHFRWQLRTFWYSLAWSVLLVGVLVLAIFSIFFGAAAPIAVGADPLQITNALIAAIIAAPVAFVLLAVAFLALSIWISYRIIRGWLALGERRPMPD